MKYLALLNMNESFLIDPEDKCVCLCVSVRVLIQEDVENIQCIKKKEKNG